MCALVKLTFPEICRIPEVLRQGGCDMRDKSYSPYTASRIALIISALALGAWVLLEIETWSAWVILSKGMSISRSSCRHR